jgi:cytochrome bd-type quinol oxidase subunit 1
MLFGLHRVGPKLHFFATCMVAAGTLMSASWILSANSWMQSPAAVLVRDGRLAVVQKCTSQARSGFGLSAADRQFQYTSS